MFSSAVDIQRSQRHLSQRLVWSTVLLLLPCQRPQSTVFSWALISRLWFAPSPHLSALLPRPRCPGHCGFTARLGAGWPQSSDSALFLRHLVGHSGPVISPPHTPEHQPISTHRATCCEVDGGRSGPTDQIRTACPPDGIEPPRPLVLPVSMEPGSVYLDLRFHPSGRTRASSCGPHTCSVRFAQKHFLGVLM